MAERELVGIRGISSTLGLRQLLWAALLPVFGPNGGPSCWRDKKVLSQLLVVRQAKTSGHSIGFAAVAGS